MQLPIGRVATVVLVFQLYGVVLTTAAWASSVINMVEGHSVHRIATRFRQTLVGRKFAATSPNGRFAEGSKRIHGRRLLRMEAVGKNLFAFFETPHGVSGGDGGGTPPKRTTTTTTTTTKTHHKDDGAGDDTTTTTVVHVHFGMSGIWSLHNSTEEPDVKPTTRLRLEEIAEYDDNDDDNDYHNNHQLSFSPENNAIVAHLSCMTCNFGGPELFTTKVAALGMDPLRHDANPDELWTKVQKSKKSIGKLLMDQSYFAGPGNIYRAEILFLAGVHPDTVGMCLDRESFDRVWNVSVQLLRRGYDTGSILTVDPLVDPQVARKGIRRYIYNRSSCARCGGVVRSWDMAGRTCYACESGCQKLMVGGGSSSSPNKKETTTLAKHSGSNNDKLIEAHTPFISHCAPIRADSRLEDHGPSALTIKEIRQHLEVLAGPDSLPPQSARKSVHVELLTAVLAASQSSDVQQQPSFTSSSVLPAPTISAEDAAREKASAGEHRGVEHVAELSSGQAMKAIAKKNKTPVSKTTKGGKRGAEKVKTIAKKTPVCKTTRGRKRGVDPPQRANATHKSKTETERKTRSRRRLKLD